MKIENAIKKGSLPQNITYKNVKINDEFFKYYQNLIINEVIPYQWKILNDEIEDTEKSSAIRNFKIAAGEIEGNFYGFVFQDSDVYKWLETAGYSLSIKRDEELEKKADYVIDLIGRAAQEDGYINTYFTIEHPELKFKDLWECHELYCAGHLFQAAVSYYNATGKHKIIKTASKFADCIDNTFGREEGKIHGYDGHEEVELGLMSLYSVTKNKRYLKLAEYFIDERGKKPYFFDEEYEKRGKTSFWKNWTHCDYPSKSNMSFSCNGLEYNQADKPVREIDEAMGHAVRVTYLLCGMADVARDTKDIELLNACERIYENIINKKMYITGAIGSTHVGEAFTGNYDLPNDYVYGETCASIGLSMFANRMNKININSKYSDIIEKEMYNGIISGIAMDGKSFFYVNPLEVFPKDHTNPVLESVKLERQKWYPCACCPPNVARFILSLGDYIYSYDDDTIYINQYIGSETFLDSSSLNNADNLNEQVNEEENSKISIKMDCNLLKSPLVNINIKSQNTKKTKIAFRIPSWTDNAVVKMNNVEINNLNIKDGYAYLNINSKE